MHLTGDQCAIRVIASWEVRMELKFEMRWKLNLFSVRAAEHGISQRDLVKLSTANRQICY